MPVKGLSPSLASENSGGFIMDKLIVFIIVLIYVIGAVFKAVQKKENENRGDTAFPRAPYPREPDAPAMDQDFPLQDKSPEDSMIRLEDLYKIFEPDRGAKKAKPHTPISFDRSSPTKQPSLEELFHRPLTQVSLDSKESKAPSQPIPIIMEKEPGTPVNLKNREDFMNLLELRAGLSSWQKAVVLHEILSQPLSLRKKSGRF
ncbi:hypothetical protein JW926_13560 [Candidatus Sumerlaeota bacterium]|nr:hypothetical protein [Candidatus Sumerlaeota bacterium]